jgi:hypothetical protein
VTLLTATRDLSLSQAAVLASLSQAAVLAELLRHDA